MKAKEYAEKYEEKITGPEYKKATYDLFIEMSKEVETICIARHVKSNCAFAAVVKEMNDKWNAIGRLFWQKYRTDILMKDGFIKFWDHEIPELKDYVS